MKIYIVLTMTGTVFSRFLRLMTNKEYTHASIALDKDFNELYSFGRRSMILPIIAGFIKEEVDKGIFKVYDTSCEILELEVSDTAYENLRNEIEKYKESYDKYKYNLLGLPFMWFDIPYEREHHLVCSQFVASVLYFSKICDFNKSWTLIRPFDFYDIEGVKSIFKGKLQDYVRKERGYEKIS